MKPAGYSGTPLWKKLGYKEGFHVRLLNAPMYYQVLLEGRPAGIHFMNRGAAPKDMIHFFTKDAEELNRQLPLLKNDIAPNGMIWVSWPKKASKVPTDITEDVIRDAAIKNGLVDVKVCAIDQTWSALKLVIPTKDRN